MMMIGNETGKKRLRGSLYFFIFDPGLSFGIRNTGSKNYIFFLLMATVSTRGKGIQVEDEE
jgi:hypothetical protein